MNISLSRQSILFSILLGIIFYFIKEENINEDLKINDFTNEYDLLSFTSPRLTGFTLKIFPYILRTKIIGYIIIRILLKQNNISLVRRFSATLNEIPLYQPVHILSINETMEHKELAKRFDIKDFITKRNNKNKAKNNIKDSIHPFKYWEINDYLDNYKNGFITPLEVIEKILVTIEKINNNTINSTYNGEFIFINVNKEQVITEAKESTLRYQRFIQKKENNLKILDGVPIAVKDEIDVKGYRTSVGTSFLGLLNGIATSDSLPVARLRQAGALIVGKTNMHEIGMGTTGYNLHFNTPRNSYNIEYFTGGSSSGSAAAVATGIVPLAIGADGGGSIRIPSALCGVVGLKPTFQRIPLNAPAVPSVGHIGPIASNVRDAAIAYAIMSGPDKTVYGSEYQPPLHIREFTDNSGQIRIGVFKEYFNDSQDEIVKKCTDLLKFYENKGNVEIIEITIPHLLIIKLAHMITISSEMTDFMDKYYINHIQKFSKDVQIMTEIARSFTSRDFLSAQRVRRYAIKSIRKIFQENQIDFIITPGTATVAPKIIENDNQEESNMSQTADLMKYIFLGNFIGIPAIVVPIGYTKKEKLPISIQIQSLHWNEHNLLHFAYQTETFLKKEKPMVYYDILNSMKENVS